MEGKAAISEALKDLGHPTQVPMACLPCSTCLLCSDKVERDLELAEFGRVYRSFRLGSFMRN